MIVKNKTELKILQKRLEQLQEDSFDLIEINDSEIGTDVDIYSKIGDVIALIEELVI